MIKSFSAFTIALLLNLAIITPFLHKTILKHRHTQQIIAFDKLPNFLTKTYNLKQK